MTETASCTRTGVNHRLAVLSSLKGRTGKRLYARGMARIKPDAFLRGNGQSASLTAPHLLNGTLGIGDNEGKFRRGDRFLQGFFHPPCLEGVHPKDCPHPCRPDDLFDLNRLPVPREGSLFRARVGLHAGH